MNAETISAAALEELQAVAGYMRGHHLLLATAESCTAGMIATMLADIPGAGALLDCAFVTYSVDAKRRCLGLDDAVLAQHNLTSEAVARAMAEGAAPRTPASVVIANTGVADDGGTGVAPGTQCYAWLFRHPAGVLAPDEAEAAWTVYTETKRFPGGRPAVRRASALYALGRIVHYHGLLQARGA